MTTVTFVKNMDEKGLGYEIYDGTGKKDITITIRVEEINWNTKKTLIKTPYPGDPDVETGTDVDFYYIDLKNVEEAVRIRGVLDDSVEVAGTATGGSNNTLIDSTKTWTVDQYINYYVKLHRANGTVITNKITDNDGTTLTVEDSWTTPQAGETYEIIYPAWMKFWQLRGMVTTGKRLDSFIIGDTSDGGLDFDGTHTTSGNSWDPPGATLEDVTMTIGADDTGQITAPQSDVSRMIVTCSLIIGDDIQNVV